MEIYNEEVRDLLMKGKRTNLEVRERADIGVYVKDLSAYVVNNADDMDRIMTVGNKNRKIFSLLIHLINFYSSNCTSTRQESMLHPSAMLH